MSESPSEDVLAVVARLRELHPAARIEVQEAWFVRAYNGDHCVDARTVKGATS